MIRRWLAILRPVVSRAEANRRLKLLMADVKPIRYRQGYERADGRVRL